MNRAPSAAPPGRIAFVGTGPGDPGLLTVRARDALAAAPLVITDPDVPESVLALVADGAEVRPAVGAPTDVARELIAEVAGGRSVTRLVAGDPLTVDAVVAEALAVSAAGVPFDVVPGVPAGTAVPAYAGVPLGSAHVEADVRQGVDWARLAASPGLIVLHATAAHLTDVASALTMNGVPAQTPVAVTTNGTFTTQRTVHATLATLACIGGDMLGPLVITIGDEVAAGRLSWWESRALYGWRVLVPRTKDQAGAMSERLRRARRHRRGVPTIAVEPPRTPTQMERAVKGLVDGRYQWVVFTSTNAVRAVWEKFAEFGLDARAFSGVKIACVDGDRRRGAGVRHHPRTYARRTSSPRPRACCRSSRRTTTCSTRSTGCCCRAPTSPPRRSPRGCASAAGRSTTSRPTARCAPRRRPRRSARRSRPAGSTPCASRRRRPCATSSASRASRMPARSSRASARRPPRPPREFGLRVDVQPERRRVPALVDALAEHAARLRAEGALPPPRKAKARRR